MRYFLTIMILITSGTSQAMTYSEIKQAYSTSYTYENKKDYNSAISALQKVFSTYPSAYTINLRLGWLNYLKKDYNTSISHYKKALHVMNYSTEARLGYTLPLIALGKYREAEAQCYIILKRDYYNYNGNLRLTRILRYQKKYSLAHYVVNKMLVFYPTDVQFLNERAILYYLQGNKKAAISLFYQILILDPLNKTALYYLK